MGFIIHPWNVVIFFMVISVAAMVYSDDDTVKNVRSVTEYSPEPREPWRFRREDSGEYTIINEDNSGPFLGDYRICVQMSHWHHYQHQCRHDNVRFLIEFDSGRYWGNVRTVLFNNMESQSTTCETVQNMYYYLGEMVTKIHVSLVRSKDTCSWFPISIAIEGYGICPARYQCKWGAGCCQAGGGATDHCSEHCYIKKEADIPCELKHWDPICNES